MYYKIKKNEKASFIKGRSSGLGRSLTETVLADGGLVAAAGINIDALKDLTEKFSGHVLPIKLDVNDLGQVQKAVDDAVAHFRRFDVLVNNAGFEIIGATEAFTGEQVRKF